MSFLNPVNEPVLRFSSADAGAPQINYNARTAGDVKAVLKACLVTGYGDKASAGWSIVNEVDHVAEFVSPSVAMSDYRLGIDDTSASSTTWYYQYQDVRTNPINNVLTKNFSSSNKTSPENGWTLLVTERGLFFVEILNTGSSNSIRARLTYFGAIKLAINATDTKNIAFWCTGASSPTITTSNFFPGLATHAHFVASSYTGLSGASAMLGLLKPDNFKRTWGIPTMDMSASIFLVKGSYLIAEQPALLLTDYNKLDGLVDVRDDVLDGRSVIYMYLGREVSSVQAPDYGNSALIYLDYWEY